MNSSSGKRREKIYWLIYYFLSSCTFFGMPGLLRSGSTNIFLVLPILFALLLLPVAAIAKGAGMPTTAWVMLVLFVGANVLISYANALSRQHDSQAGLWWLGAGACFALVCVLFYRIVTAKRKI